MLPWSLSTSEVSLWPILKKSSSDPAHAQEQMTIENHRHDLEAVLWKRPTLSEQSVRTLGLPISRYHRLWHKDGKCTLLGCDAVVVYTTDSAALRLAQEKFVEIKLLPESANSGVLVDFELLKNPRELSYF